MLTQETHCSKYDNMKQNTNVKSDIKYHKRHFKILSFQELTQGSKSTDGTSTRTSKRDCGQKQKRLLGKSWKINFSKKKLVSAIRHKKNPEIEKVEKSSKKIKQQSKKVQATKTIP